VAVAARTANCDRDGVHADRNGVLLLTERARRRLPAIVDDLMDRQLREVPEFFVTDDPAYRQAVRSSTHTNTELMIEAVRTPGAIPRALPPGPRLEADVAAQHGATVHSLLRTYRLGQQALLEHLLDDLDREGEQSVRHVGAALREATRALFDYMETVMPLVAGEYGAEQARLHARPDLKRLRLVEAILAGDESADIGYSLDGPHVALVAQDDHAEAAVAHAAHALEAPWIAVRSADGRCLAWVGSRALAELQTRLREEGLAGPGGLGGPADGAAGFRAAHRQALLAERIARSRRQQLVDLRSSAIEALALGGQRTAWEVAHAELGPLAASDPASLRLRATLEAWFAARERLAEAADALGVAPRTVSYRLRRAEALMGSTIAERRAELEAALRVVRLFEGDPPPPGP
jgi:hypothetical protein